MKKIFLCLLICLSFFITYEVSASGVDYKSQADELIQYAIDNDIPLDKMYVGYFVTDYIILFSFYNDDINFQLNSSGVLKVSSTTNIQYTQINYQVSTGNITVPYKNSRYYTNKDFGSYTGKVDDPLIYVTQNVLNADGTVFFQKNYPDSYQPVVPAPELPFSLNNVISAYTKYILLLFPIGLCILFCEKLIDFLKSLIGKGKVNL